MPYEIQITDFAYEELMVIKAFYRSRIIDAIDEQLAQEPTAETRNRKPLIGLHTVFPHQAPVWELRVGAYRVYYDVSEESRTVSVRSVRQKPPHHSTEQIV